MKIFIGVTEMKYCYLEEQRVPRKRLIDVNNIKSVIEPNTLVLQEEEEIKVREDYDDLVKMLSLSASISNKNLNIVVLDE